MKVLTAIVEDILAALGPPYLAEIAGSPSANAPYAAMRRIAGVADDDRTLCRWLAENLGRTSINLILRKLELPFDSAGSVEDAISQWLEFRGIVGKQPSPIALHRVALLLEESARQAAVDPAKYDAARLLLQSLQWLLRHIAFYYFDDLKPTADSGGQQAAYPVAAHRQELDATPLPVLCRFLNQGERVRAKPYDSSSGAATTLHTPTAHESLATIERVTERCTDLSHEDAAALCAAVRELVVEWHHRARMIPKGATIRTVEQTALKTMLRCVDEHGHELRLIGAPTRLAVLDHVLLGADECDEAWAPNIRALPDTWPLPDTLRRTLRVPQAARNGIFISYSHADGDDQLRSEIENGLKALGVKEAVGCWSDVAIDPGSDWRREIELALARSKVFVCLLSTDFLASDFIRDVEIPAILAAQRKGARILWVLSRYCSWEESSFASLQAAYPTKKALNQLNRSNRDVALTIICKAIQDACLV